MSSALDEHIGYFADDVRLERYRAAIPRVLRPGDLVADVGCGSGILGLLCLQAGAGHVWGIDSTDMIEAARETCARAGLADRYTCIRDTSFRVTLPEPVDLAICDHVGYFGFDYGIIDVMGDARRRFLKPGGKVLPARIRPMLGLVASEACRSKAEAWGRAPVPTELHWLRTHGINAKHAVTLTPAEILGPPAGLGLIDLASDCPAFLSFEATLEAGRDGVVHGLAGWFDCELADGIRMTNSPVAADAIVRPQAFLPIDQLLEVRAGEKLQATIMARPSDQVLAWTLDAPAAGRRFSQSTWRGTLLSPLDMARSQPDRVPRLSRAGQARGIVASYCDGRRTIREIEQMVLRSHPDLFPTTEEISRFVLATLGRDTE